jgi:hypothetical protein
LFDKNAMKKALAWRVCIAIPLGTFLTYLWFGHVMKSIEFMLFINVLFTGLHYSYEIFWDKYILRSSENDQTHQAHKRANGVERD